MTELRGTTAQRLIHLNTHWGRQYDFAAPTRAHAKWTAKAKFGSFDELEAETSAELLELVRAHYQANWTGDEADES
jgi:hypothetical protein